MKTVAIVQARMGSTRLPGKVLADLAGVPVLARILMRLEAVGLDEIVVATTTKTEDDVIASLAKRNGASVFRGSEHDVLARYVGAARQSGADAIVRITADCPLLDAGVVRRVLMGLLTSRRDFASNAIVRTFPRGLDAEALWADVLYRVDRLATTPAAREHVTWHIYREAPQLFLSYEVRDSEDNSDLSWTLDTFNDLCRIRSIFERGEDHLAYRELLERERFLMVAV